MIVNTYETKAFVCLQRQQLKSRLGSFYASTLDSKLARTFTDDVDLSHGADRKLHQQNRPGQRDDENICTLGRMLPI